MPPKPRPKPCPKPKPWASAGATVAIEAAVSVPTASVAAIRADLMLMKRMIPLLVEHETRHSGQVLVGRGRRERGSRGFAKILRRARRGVSPECGEAGCAA